MNFLQIGGGHLYPVWFGYTINVAITVPAAIDV